MKFLLREDQVEYVRKSLNEMSGGYTDEDYVEVFIKHFRNWIRETHGDEVSKYPMSYLVKKYTNDFIKEYLKTDDTYYGSSLGKISKLGQKIIKLKLDSLPSLKPSIKFSEKYKIPLERAIKIIGIPEYISVNLIEEEPYVLDFKFIVDFAKMLKDNSNNRPYNIRKYYHSIEKILREFMGVEFGEPVHGELRANYYTQYVGEEEWTKMFNKEIKKQIKALPGGQNIRAIKLSKVYDGQLEIKLMMNRYSSSGYEMKNKVMKFLEDLGYNIENFRVDY